MSQHVSFANDPASYHEWLRKELSNLHAAVKQNKIEIKQTDKEAYDKSHAARIPTWTVGDQVLLKSDKIKAHAAKVLTHRPFIGPYFISEIVQRDDTIGPSYRLIDVNTGRTYLQIV